MCIHFQERSEDQHQLLHPETVERQISMGGRIGDHDISLWATNQLERLEILREESACFFIRERLSAGQPTGAICELVPFVDKRVRSLAGKECRSQLVLSLAEQIGDDVSSSFWDLVAADKAPWAEICLGRFVINLTKDVIRQYRNKKQSSLDSDLIARSSVFRLAAKGPSLEQELYAVEKLMSLKPNQRRAVVLRYGFGLSQRVIGELLSRSERSIRNLLRAAERELHLVE